MVCSSVLLFLSPDKLLPSQLVGLSRTLPSFRLPQAISPNDHHQLPLLVGLLHSSICSSLHLFHQADQVDEYSHLLTI